MTATSNTTTHVEHSAAVDALRQIARVSIPELNPDGADQSADTMRLIAVSALEAAGIVVPQQRVSVATAGQEGGPDVWG